jgi:hypothetical protein
MLRFLEISPLETIAKAFNPWRGDILTVLGCCRRWECGEKWRHSNLFEFKEKRSLRKGRIASHFFGVCSDVKQLDYKTPLSAGVSNA